jgi:hypothetical protein
VNQPADPFPVDDLRSWPDPVPSPASQGTIVKVRVHSLVGGPEGSGL